MSKKPKIDQDDDLRPEYDLKKLSGGISGKYYRAAKAGTNVVLIDPDVATIVPTREPVRPKRRRRP